MNQITTMTQFIELLESRPKVEWHVFAGYIRHEKACPASYALGYNDCRAYFHNEEEGQPISHHLLDRIVLVADGRDLALEEDEIALYEALQPTLQIPNPPLTVK